MQAAGAGSIPAAGRVTISLHCIFTVLCCAYFRIGMHDCVYLHMYDVHLAYVCMLALARGFMGVVCSVLLGRGDSKTARIRILSNVAPSMRAAAARIEYQMHRRVPFCQRCKQHQAMTKAKKNKHYARATSC